MKKTTRNLYTILSLLPIVLFIVYMSVFVSIFVDLFHHMDEMNEHPEQFFPFDDMGTILIMGIILALVSLAAMVLFIMHVFNNKDLPENERIIWVLVFVFAGMIGFPVYWFARGIKYDPPAPQSSLSKTTR